MSGRQYGSLARTTVLGAGWIVAWRMTTRVLGLVSTLFLARILVPADFGLVALAAASSEAVEALSMLGLQDALVRDRERSRSLYDTAFTLIVGRAVANAVIVAALAYPASLWFAEPRLVPVLLILAALAALAGFENIGIVEFRRNLQFDKEFLLLFPPRLCGVVVTILLAVQFRSYWALIGGILTVRILRFVLTYYLNPYRPRLSLERWRHLVAFSSWTWAIGLASFCWDRSETFILGHTMGSEQIGLFLIAMEIAVLPVTELVSPASKALFSGFSAALRTGTDVGTASISVAGTLMMLVAPLALVLSAASGDITRILLGPQWVAAEPLITICAIFSIPAVFSQVFSSVLVAQARLRAQFLIVVSSAVLKIPVVFLVASTTGRLQNIAWVLLAAATFEAWLFMLVIKHAAPVSTRIAMPSLWRTTLATLVSIAIIALTGIGWRNGALSVGDAILDGIGVGAAAVVTFVSVQGVLWFIAGRPEGEETRLIRLVSELFAQPRPRISA
jgi:lipopolysaccharide exporter